MVPLIFLGIEDSHSKLKFIFYTRRQAWTYEKINESFHFEVNKVINFSGRLQQTFKKLRFATE